MSNAFHYKWKKFLFEEQHQLLLEAKVKDVKKKYPKLNATNWIVWAQRQLETLLGPKGVSKYLMWFARELHSNFTEDIAELDIEDTHQRSRFAESSDVLEISEAILTAITEFQQNQQRMEEKDIYKYNAGEMQSALSRLGLSSKQKRDREKESAMGDTEVVYDDNDIFAVRPLSEISSCYFGKNTRWCISATETRNYFDQYTDDRKAFVMVRFENLPEDHVLKKIAIVYDSDGEIEEYFNAQDNS